MARNKIVSLDLESRAIELKSQGRTFRDIASVLSEESKHEISHSSVKRFFDANDRAMVRVVEKTDKLKARVAEAEINTIDEVMECIDELKKICKAAQKDGDNRTAVLAVDKIFTGLDIVNKVLGKYKVSMPEGGGGINIMFYLPNNNRDEKVVDITDDN